jgi:hypothetical protein
MVAWPQVLGWNIMVEELVAEELLHLIASGNQKRRAGWSRIKHSPPGPVKSCFRLLTLSTCRRESYSLLACVENLKIPNQQEAAHSTILWT